MPATRREALEICAGIAAFLAWPSTNQAAPARSEDALDHALELIHGAEPKGRQGLSTHAPMVAETLCALGHPERAVSWVEGYRAPLLDLPVPSRRIDRARWREALGPRRNAPVCEAALARWGDWVVFFGDELAT